MAQVPSNLIPVRVTQLPDAPAVSEDGLLIYIYNGNTYKVRAGDLFSVLSNQPANYIFAGPESGADGLPGFRRMVQDDLPLAGISGGTF